MLPRRRVIRQYQSEFGSLAPPVGLNLLLASYHFEKANLEVMCSVVPMLLVLYSGVWLITYIPMLATWLPVLLHHGKRTPLVEGEWAW